MKKTLFLSLSLCLTQAPLSAQKTPPVLQPVPQQIETDGRKIANPKTYQLVGTPTNNELRMITQVLGNCTQPQKKGFTLIVGDSNDKALKKYRKLIPQRAEGYYLKVDEKSIVAAGYDQRGTYYALQTLAQLQQGDSLVTATITDYPDVAARGVVEGFYGTPWSHEARLRQLDFYGKNKLNTYIYGPKDDPYHTSPNWRKPYPEKEAEQIKELVAASARNEVNFVWAIHPGRDIRWDEADREALLEKFEKMYELGVRSFAVFFDDISGEGTKADRQAELLNAIDNRFVKVKGDVTPLIMCPTEYNKSWSNVQGGYLTTLGDKLNPGIEVMWTGDRVIACIDKPTMNWINPLIKRKAYIWWNFPVSDYVRDHLLLGPVYGNTKDIKDDMSGFVANPMERAEASKIALYSVADYAWNTADYDSLQSWNRALQDLMPTDFAALRTFASHNSDLGPNGHGFRREESTELQPALQGLLEAFKQGKISANDYEAVNRELEAITQAADLLLTTEEAPYFVAEIKPWLRQFGLLGRYGQEVLQLMRTTQANTNQTTASTAFSTRYRHARALQKQMYRIDITENQNPYQPGVKTGSRILLPTLNELFALSTTRYNQAHGTNFDASATYSPFTLSSTVEQLRLQPIQARGKQAQVSPSNEVIKWQANGTLTIAFDRAAVLDYLQFNLGSDNVAQTFELAVSRDGSTWQPLPLRQEQGNHEVHAMQILSHEINYIRLRNKSGQDVQVYFKQFRFGTR